MGKKGMAEGRGEEDEVGSCSYSRRPTNKPIEQQEGRILRKERKKSQIEW